MNEKNIIFGSKQLLHFVIDVFQNGMKFSRTVMNHGKTAGCKNSGCNADRTGGKQNRMAVSLHSLPPKNGYMDLSKHAFGGAVLLTNCIEVYIKIQPLSSKNQFLQVVEKQPSVARNN